MRAIQMACALSALSSACTSSNQSGERFMSELEIASPKLVSGQQLDLAKINPGPWDRVIVFPPYTSSKEVENLLMTKLRPELKQLRLDVRDDINLLVFLSGQQVEMAVAVPRAVADFSAPTTPIDRADALFTKQRGNAFVRR